MLKVRRTTAHGAEHGHAPSWYTWHSRVMLVCNNGHFAALDHVVDAAGVVTPSVECPTPGCGFHEMVQLEDWDPSSDPRST